MRFLPTLQSFSEQVSAVLLKDASSSKCIPLITIFQHHKSSQPPAMLNESVATLGEHNHNCIGASLALADNAQQNLINLTLHYPFQGNKNTPNTNISTMFVFGAFFIKRACNGYRLAMLVC